MAYAIPAGLVLAAALGAAAAALGFSPEQPVVGALVLGACTAGPLIGLVWVAVVDRNSIDGAVANPEESVEHRWLDSAAIGALADVFVVAGLGAAALSFVPSVQVDGATALLAVTAVIVISFSLRYALARRKG